MATYIALLRGINVSGQKKIKMDELKKHLLELPITDIISYIQSGNLIFSSPLARSKVKAKIEQKIKLTYGYHVVVFVCTPTELEQVINDNPFNEISEDEFNRLHVVFLSDVPNDAGLMELSKLKNDDEQIVSGGNILYIYTPGGIGKSKLNSNNIERKLKVDATARNFRTFHKLLSLLEQF